MTRWERIKWRLFGELRMLYWILWLAFAGGCLMLGSFGWIVFHFVAKYW